MKTTSILLALTTAAAFSQGPLAPDAAPEPSMKTLAEIEPRIAINAANTPGDADSLFKITQPGSYYLAGNITGVAGKHGIWIQVSDVILDLNGFTLKGVPGSLNGVVGPVFDIAVINGFVRQWGGEGVGLASFGSFNHRVERVIATNNGGNGIGVAYASTVSNCSARSNGGAGIFTVNDCIVTDCVANENAGSGFRAGTPPSGRSTYLNCISTENTGSGFEPKDGATITNCTAYSNNNFGILAGVGCTISNCTLNTNFSHGISVGSDSSVTGCTARENGYHGILATADCVINGNICNDNGTLDAILGAGIHTTGANNRIEGNNCSNNERGIECPTGSTGNLIIRNSASSNSINFSFVANNRYGNILDITGTTVAVSGNSATGTLATSDPHANFRY